MHQHIILISDEASGRIKTKEINPVCKKTIVPYDKLKKMDKLNSELRGHSFTHIKINTDLTAKEYKDLYSILIPSMSPNIK